VARNVEQLIYSSYGWEREVGSNVVKEFWDSLAKYCKAVEVDDAYHGNDAADMEDVVSMFGNLDKGESFVAVRRGAITARWWSIGEAADMLFKTLPMRHFMAKNYDDMTGKGKGKEIAQTFLSLSKEPVLISDVALIKCYHRHYLARHLKYLQKKDVFSRKPGFQAFSIFVVVF
jgi:hypothetical protein